MRALTLITLFTLPLFIGCEGVTVSSRRTTRPGHIGTPKVHAKQLTRHEAAMRNKPAPQPRYTTEEPQKALWLALESLTGEVDREKAANHFEALAEWLRKDGLSPSVYLEQNNRFHVPRDTPKPAN